MKSTKQKERKREGRGLLETSEEEGSLNEQLKSSTCLIQQHLHIHTDEETRKSRTLGNGNNYFSR